MRPSDTQTQVMEQLRSAAKVYAGQLERLLPEGADKTYTLRKLRDVTMWTNVCLLRQADGSPRASGEVSLPRDYPPGHPAEGDLGSVPLL